jgi:hypothetical protein
MTLALLGCSSTPDADADADATEGELATSPPADVPRDPASIARAAVVYVQQRTPGQTGTCTGTLVAPNLVVTAHHCIAEISTEPTVCTLPGTTLTTLTDSLSRNLAATAFVVSRSGERPDDSPRLRCSAIDAGVARVLDDGTMTMCDGHDVAWLVLDRPIELGAYPPVRMDAPSRGEKTVTYGWGRVAKDGPFTRLLKEMHGTVVAPESSSYPEGGCIDGDGDPAGVVGHGDIVTDTNSFHGDSGGPVFDAAWNLTGVVSRGEEGGTCITSMKAARLGANRDAMVAALAAAKASSSDPVPPLPRGDSCIP